MFRTAGRMVSFFTCFFALSVVFAQNQQLADSLKRVDLAKLETQEKLSVLRKLTLSSSSPEDKIKYAHDLLSIARENQEFEYQVEAQLSLGTAYRLKGRLIEANKFLFVAAEMAEANDLKKQLGLSYTEISSSYADNGDYLNSIEYSKKGIEIFDSIGEKLSKALTLLNVGYYFYELGTLDSAMFYYDVSEGLLEDIKLPIGQAYVMGNKALVKARLGDFQIAEVELVQAIDALKEMGDGFGVADYLNQLAQICKTVGRQEEAIKNAKEAIQISEDLGLLEQIRDGNKILSDLYTEKGDFESALKAQSVYILYKDSIRNTKVTQQLADERTAYEVGLKQAELDLTNAQKQNQQYFLIGTAAFAFLLIALVALVYRLLLNKQKANLQLAQLNNTKDRFFSIISHDIRGPVQAFNGVSRMIKFMVDNDQVSELRELADQIDESADRLSSLLDNLLNWAVQQQGQINYVPEKISAQEMLDELAGTFTNMAQAKNIEITQNVPDGLCIWSDRNTTNTILRNLINNALKFTPEQGKIDIQGSEEDGMVVFKISDTGVGIPSEKLENLFQLEAKKSTWGTEGEKGLGLGLQLVKEFVEMNKGALSVTSKEGVGTTFIIQLPSFKD